LAFSCSISIGMVSFRVVCEIAMVPDSECGTPTLIVSAWANATRGSESAAAAAAPDRSVRLESFMVVPCSSAAAGPSVSRKAPHIRTATQGAPVGW
jgi:PAB1-binding protein PBP1